MTMLGKIDVFINSASRLDYLIPTVSSFLNNMKYSMGFRLVLHDDVVKKIESAKIAKWVEESKIFDSFLVTEPAKRLGHAIHMELRLAQSPYIINWEDDWRLLKVIPLDEILGYMEKNPKINQVVFNHNANETSKHEVIRPVLDCGTFKLTQIQEWAIGPGIWRTDFTKAKWPNHADAHYCLTAFGSINLREGRDMKWMAENVGNYFYGGHLEGPFVEHLGINSVWNAPIDGRGNG
jgi:hypothetical protein